MAMLIGQALGETIDWGNIKAVIGARTLPTPFLIEAGEVVAPYIREDDVLVSSHELIWTFHHHRAFYSMAGELTGFKRWRLNPVSLWRQISNGEISDIRFLGATRPVVVWNYLRPTVVVDISGPIILTPGLRDYMRAHKFQVCRRLPFGNAVIQIYRPSCNAPDG
jgi:hypothetical protein